jgi:predicted RNA-binding Zn-ribbon protein involved in translation (DUF1610 family)
MSARQDVILVEMLCSATGHPGIGRLVHTGTGWNLVGVSRQRPGTGLPPGDAPVATGAFYADPAYQGCPSCGARGFVRCGKCDHLGCWHEESEVFRCAHCGSSGPITGTIESLDSLGGG